MLISTPRSHAIVSPLQVGRFKIIKPLARAIHGHVFLCRDRSTGKLLAMKKLHNSRFMAHNQEDPVADAGTSILLSQVSCDSLLKTLGVFQDETYTYLISEYGYGIELWDAAYQRHIVPAPQARSVIGSVLRAISCMHALGIAHRDVSLENCLIYPDGRVKVIDFGQTVNMHDARGPLQYMGLAGKPYYMAPEMYGRGLYHPGPADIFSVGVVLFIMLFGSPPWESAQLSDERFEIFAKGSMHAFTIELVDEDIQDMDLITFLDGLLSVKPGLRLSADEALEHPWMKQVEAKWTF